MAKTSPKKPRKVPKRLKAQKAAPEGEAVSGARGRGRPSTYAPSVATDILSRLALGESLRQICSGEGMPPHPTVLQWVTDDVEGFADRYARARDAGFDIMAEQTLEIADDGSNDTYVDGEGRRKVDHDVVNRSRLRVDTRKWLLSKMVPKKYGDRLDLTVDDKRPSTPEERRARIVELMALGVGKGTQDG